MHAYLLVGPDAESVKMQAKELAKNIGESCYEFSIMKIDEVRKLSSFVKFSLDKPTAIIISDIEKATEVASNALLKNMEEPQKNLTYILTSSSEEKLIPTIVSRCQVVRVTSDKSKVTNQKEIQDFIEMSVGEKFGYLDKIKKRDEALDFVQSIIHILHVTLVKGKKDLNVVTESLKLAESTHKRLQANGNVNLQLTNFATTLSHL